MTSTEFGGDSGTSQNSRVARIWIVWIVAYNAAFIAFLAWATTAELNIIGFLPSTVWVYVSMLTVIGVTNWILGWKLMRSR